MNADYQEIMELTEDPKIIEYSQTLNKLRENGVNKIKKLRQDSVALAKNKATIDELVKESVAYANKAAKRTQLAIRSE